MPCRKPYYVLPRKPSGIYYYIVRAGRKTVEYKSLETTDEGLANSKALDWWKDGVPGKEDADGIDPKTTFCDFLFNFWDFEKSEHFREQETMGKNPQPDHALHYIRFMIEYMSYYSSVASNEKLVYS